MRVITVTDRDQPEISDYSQLTDVALRIVSEPEDGLYIAESPKVISRALAAGHQPRSVLVLARWLPRMAELFRDHPEITVYTGEPELLESLTGFNLHRGALAAMHRPPLPPVSELLRDARTIVILEDVVDHTNVGAIFRSVAGLGADAVLISPNCADPFYRRSVRVSMGTVFQVPWTRMGAWDETLPALKQAGFHLAALALNENAVSLADFARNRPEKVALVMGTEGDGLSARALAAADTQVMIPMMHGVNSLNVAAASAVTLWALGNTGLK